MTRWLIVLSPLIAFSLGGCSSSGDELLTRAELAADNADYCKAGSMTGMAALNGSQAAYTQCMQQRYAAGAAGFRREDSFASGRASSLATVSQ
jgi:hypothetical protein